MLISIKISRISDFSGLDKPVMLFFLLINVEMPIIVGIFTFMSRKMSRSAELSMIFPQGLTVQLKSKVSIYLPLHLNPQGVCQTSIDRYK